MIPAGYERLLLGHTIAVARSDVASDIRSALVNADGTRGTLHEFAARQPEARSMAGRGTAYSILLPRTGLRVVVRHNRHGGLFAGMTGDRFFAPTRAPIELETSLALRELGVPTPEMVGYALYPPGGIVQRADVVTREIERGRDLAHILVSGAEDRAASLQATANLVAAMSRAGVRHPDLNAKNVLINPERAWVLDVDRVRRGEAPDRALSANLARLARSLRKWRDHFGARVTDDEIARMEQACRQAVTHGTLAPAINV
jgi:3-deoxy-D-manno-octulosonic acid kinase